MDAGKLLAGYLNDNKLMQLATVANGQPWVCSVYYVSDESNRIYWTSGRSRRHSVELKADSKVGATIVQDANRKQAVQIAGRAFEVPFDDVERVNKLYGEKFGDKPSRLQEVFADTPDGRAYWALEPRTIELWDEVNFPNSPKQVIEMI